MALPVDWAGPRAEELSMSRWMSEEYLCEEHVDVKDESTYEDAKGIRRKRMHANQLQSLVSQKEARNIQRHAVVQKGYTQFCQMFAYKQLICQVLTPSSSFVQSWILGMLASGLGARGGMGTVQPAKLHQQAALNNGQMSGPA